MATVPKKFYTNIALPNSNYLLTMDAPTLSGDFTLTLPGADSAANNVMVSDGSGNLSLAALVNANVSASAAIALSKLAAVTADRALISDGSGYITASTVTATELGYVDGVTSAIQTQLNGKASLALDNLAAVAINTSLVSDTDNTDNLGSASIAWAAGYINKLYLDSNSQTTTIAGSPSASASVDYILPAADGASGTVLSTNGSGVLSWSSVPSASAGDIEETSFAAANNQSAPANVTGLAFANGTVRSFKALVSVYIDATGDLFEVFELFGIQKGSDWDMSVMSTGDDSNVEFTITSAGQVQYTSGNESGFVSNTIKFRADTTSV
jgi:hypothetical protein